jgi:hypothetical protein
MIALAGILAFGSGPARGADPPLVYVSGGYHWAPGYYQGGRFFSAPAYYYFAPGYYYAAPSSLASSNVTPTNVHQAPGRPSIPRQDRAASGPSRPWSPSVGGNFQGGGYGGMPHFLHARGWDSAAHAEWLRQEQLRQQARRP